MKLKLCTVLLTAVSFFTSMSVLAQKAPDATAQKAAAIETFGKLPLSFEPTADATRFVAHSGGYSVAVGAREAQVVVNDQTSHSSKALRFGFAHATAAGPLDALEPQAGVTNYYLGSDPANWRLGVRNYAKVRAQGVYPGIDVVYYGDHRRLEFDFNVAPKADPGVIALTFSGMDKLYKDAAGDLVAEINGHAVRFAKPFAYQRIAGASKSVPVDYELASAATVRLRLGSYDSSAELIIDPVVSFVTYLGGSAADQVNGIAVDSSGNVYVTGTTSSTDFPDGAKLLGSIDAFVMKYNAAGTQYIYNTIIGGTTPSTGTASGSAIALDSNNQAYITGTTNFTNIPGNVNYANGLNTYQGGDSDAYVVILQANGTLLRSTYLGGSGPDSGLGIAVDTNSTISATYPNAVIVVGQTRSATEVPFPGYNAFETPIEEWVAFVTKLDNNLHICREPNNGASVMTPLAIGGNPPCFFSLTFGGQPVAPYPSAFWAGNTSYPLYTIIEDNLVPPNIQIATFPGVSSVLTGTVTNPWNSSLNGITTDGGITWVNIGPALIKPPTATSQANAVALDPHGDVFAAGGTDTANLGATINSFGPYSHYSGSGAWVLKVSGLDGAHLYGTALETKGNVLSAAIDTAQAIAVDALGRAYVVGTASAGSLMTTPGSYSPGSFGGQDAFLIRMNTSGSNFDYGTYLGGSGNDQGLGVAVDSSGAAYVTGATQSTDFPTINPLNDPNSVPQANSPVLTLNGPQDAFVSKFTVDGSALIFSTYLGGSGSDQGNAIAIDTGNQGNMYVAGTTYSPDLEQLNPSSYTAPQGSLGGSGDGFVAMIAGASLPTVTVTPGSLSFGVQDENVASTPVAIQYTNTNTLSSVNISTIAFGGTNPGDFYQTFPAGTPANCAENGMIAPSSACDIWVVFSPTGPGRRSGTLTIWDAVSSNPHVISLAGTGAVPEDSFSVTSLTFASQLVNTSSAAQFITLQDTGQGILNIASIGISASSTNPGDFSQSSTCTAQLASASSCTIKVVFTPSALGTRTAVLVVTDNASGSPHQIALTGTAIAVANTITPSLTFGQQSLNSTSSPMPVTVQNTDATQTLTITGATITGDFQISTNGCLTSLAPNATCIINVTFNPTATGQRTGTLTISGNGAGMPAAVALSGTGVSGSGTISLSPTTLTFGSQQQGTTSSPQVVTVSNSASAALTVSSIVLTGNTDFAISATTCATAPFVLAGSGTCTVSLTFKPTGSGAENATLTVNGSSSNSPQKVTITGNSTSVGPTGADFTVTPNSSGVSVVQGGTATFVLTVAPVNGFNSNIGFTCSGPTGSSCSFSPSTLSMDGTTTHTVQFTVGTSGGNGTSARLTPGQVGVRGVFFALLPFGMMGMLLTKRRRGLGLVLLLLVVCLAMGMAACGAAPSATSGSSGALAPGTYSITVTAASTGNTVVTHPLTLSLNVTSK